MVIILLKFGHRSLTLKPTPHQHLPWSGLPTQPFSQPLREKGWEKGENPTDRARLTGEIIQRICKRLR